MALKDLIASQAAFSEEVIEGIISDYVRFDADHELVVFTPEAHALSNKSKVLIYLVALQGWPFVVDKPLVSEVKPGDIEERTGIPGGSLRPILMEMKDRNLIVERGGRYSVRAVALQAVKKELNAASPSRAGSSKRKAPKGVSKKAANDADLAPNEPEDKRPRRGTSTNKVSEHFGSLIDKGFFDKSKTLADVQRQLAKEAIILPQTSIPSYLLTGIRSGRLEREKEKVGGKVVWVYKKRT